ncbi:putative kinase-like protein TMKL1 [Selaginella moellendorffii]|uniref:putative kinase-like protein TMKL1 n=1 Tax=Selaginella moellendorffii TaxID=88036 RepID=UPI000D1C767D|nr:putative kinase-like protein TMKL1 [Selaginella moellendorffii]|eukprot:XP_024534395.1 putative kinase-like protein TMKL1 [Selaginella moellendorffii]
MHCPGIEPGSVPWQGTILPLDQQCLIDINTKLFPSLEGYYFHHWSSQRQGGGARSEAVLQAVVTVDLGKLVETLLDLAYSAQHCREKSKTLALKVELLSESIAELIEKREHFTRENFGTHVRRLEVVFNDAIYLLRKYRNGSIFVKIFKAPHSEDGFDSINQRLEICIQYFGFSLQVRNESKVSNLAEENRQLRSMIQSIIQQQQVDMRRLLSGELKSEEKDAVNAMLEGLTFDDDDEVYDEHTLCATLEQPGSSSATRVLLLYSEDLGETELAILKRLSESHVNILQFFGTYVDGKTKYAVMERPGKEISTLDEFIHNKPELKDGHWSLKKNFALEIAMGLQYAHAVGVVHKNLRSPNIFIDDSQDLRPKIFGFNQGRIEALKSDKRPQSKEQVRWKAPEMLPQANRAIRRPEYSYACDIFSLGVVMWEIVTWSFPFEQIKGVRGVLEARARRGMTLDFSALPPGDRSPALQAFVQISMDCMEQDSGTRPNVDEVVERLSQLVPEDMTFSSL